MKLLQISIKAKKNYVIIIIGCDRMNKYENIDNSELKKILMFVKDEPIFFDDEKRLLSKQEILNYKVELQTNLDIVPLIDLYDNNYLIYNIAENQFQLLDISDDTIWKNVSSIIDYINLIEQYLK